VNPPAWAQRESSCLGSEGILLLGLRGNPPAWAQRESSCLVAKRGPSFSEQKESICSDIE
jgi:hypothetical protein